jgi:drug/metabolite transporter (DMT)-like permease
VDQYSHRHYLAYTVIFGTLFLVPLSLPAFFHQDWTAVQISDWVAVLYSAFFSLVFGYSAWYYAVGKIGSTRTAVYSNLTPVAGLLVAMIFLGDRLSPLQWIGAALILAGLIVNRMARVVEMLPEEGIRMSRTSD